MVNLDELRDFLLMRRAAADLIAWTEADLAGTPVVEHLDVLPPMAYEDAESLLAGLLDLGIPAIEPLDQAHVQRFLQLCEQLGFDDVWIDTLMMQRVTMSLEVVTALAWLQLPRAASTTDIQAAHRRMAKLYHPDRVTHLADEFQELAKVRTAQLNRARDALLEWRNSETPPLEFMDIDWRDAPTDIDGVTDALELLDD